MTTTTASAELLGLLNDALAREIHVSVRYMLQHAVGAAWSGAGTVEGQAPDMLKFIASHSSVFMPGASLKKVAISEMRHAEAIGERIVLLGGALTPHPAPMVLGTDAREMLALDREAEQGAIDLYTQIVDLAKREGDAATLALFRKVLADERKHQRLFEGFLGAA
jgi:bacterioferritin